MIVQKTILNMVFIDMLYIHTRKHGFIFSIIKDRAWPNLVIS